MFLCKGTKSGVNKAVRAGQKKAHILEVELLKMDEEEKKLNINRCDYVTSAAEYYGKTIAYVSIPQKKSKNTFRNLCVTILVVIIIVIVSFYIMIARFKTQRPKTVYTNFFHSFFSVVTSTTIICHFFSLNF